MFTDASTEGWGAHLDSAQAEGRWTLAEQKLHINNLELRSVLLALQEFESLVTHHHVLVMTDNTTVVGQIKNQGGIHARELFLVTKELFLWADQRQVILSAQHIPGKLNVLADMLSCRHQITQTEWSLAPPVALQIWKVWGQPHLVLFATVHNAKLPLFVSPYPEPTAWDTDALSLSWKGMWAYAFPPFSLLAEVLLKASQEQCDLILVAPAWPTQSWFHHLLELSVDHPRCLPSSSKLLRQPGSLVFHDNIHRLHLHAWRLSSRPCAKKGSLRRWLNASLAPIDPVRDRFTTASGTYSASGASLEDGIRSLPLPQ